VLDAVPGLTNDYGHCICGEGVGLEATILISPNSQASTPTLELISHLELVADVLAHVATVPSAPAALPARAATEPVLVNEGGTARGLADGRSSIVAPLKSACASAVPKACPLPIPRLGWLAAPLARSLA